VVSEKCGVGSNLRFCISFLERGSILAPMLRFPGRWRRLCALLLICAGACGILFAPTVGLFLSKELRSFTFTSTHEKEWGTAITTSRFELPFIRNSRGIIFMTACMAGSIAAIFYGVHWYTVLGRRRTWRAGPSRGPSETGFTRALAVGSRHTFSRALTPHTARGTDPVGVRAGPP
jgi:hypothetical protein